MVDVRDIRGHLICRGDAATGLVEHRYKHCTVRTYLDVGASITVEQDGIVTKITRINNRNFRVSSHCLAA